MIRQIIKELRNHAPFTMFGAVTGIIIMMLFRNLPKDISYNLFYVFHPAHILLSALVTASMYGIYKKGKYKLWMLLAIGYLGSVGIATLSDSVIPYLGEALLRMPDREIHLGFIEEWWLVNPLAIAGILIAYFKPSTKFPHALHVLLSTWASLFHIIMAVGGSLNWVSYIVAFIFLFIAVWIPCCVSDIVFPLLFIKD
ncbi:MAG: hypothetical protein ABIJ15_04390 [bacterium]